MRGEFKSDYLYIKDFVKSYQKAEKNKPILIDPLGTSASPKGKEILELMKENENKLDFLNKGIKEGSFRLYFGKSSFKLDRTTGAGYEYSFVPPVIEQKESSFTKKIDILTTFEKVIEDAREASALRLKAVFDESKLEGDGYVNAQNIGIAVFPLVEYIHKEKPDMIIACDRGARLIGLAVFELYRGIYGDLPTMDGTLRFARISRNIELLETERILRPLVKEVLRDSKSSNPKVLVLDDWVGQGRTRDLAKNAIRDLSNGKIDVVFGAMCNGKGDVYGTVRRMGADWCDREYMIGVDYDGSAHAMVVGSRESHEYREEMQRSIGALMDAARKAQ